MRVAELVRELRRDLGSAKLVPALSAGSTTGLGLLVAHVAYATLIFSGPSSGPLAAHASEGIGLVLFATFAGCLIVALVGGFRGAIAGLSPALVIVMAHVGATLDAASDALFVTTATALAVGAAGIGACCFLIGRLHLANLVRFIPYPVAGGFVAGIGGAVCLAAMSMMGAELGWATVPALVEPETLTRWLPGAVYGIGLYVAIRRWGNPLILPLSVVLMVAGYQVALALIGMSGDEARDGGLLFAGTAAGTLWPSIGPADLALVDWAALSAQIPNLLVLGLVAFICVVMSLAGLEVALNEDLDWDREFRAAGSASVAGGLGGGTFVCMIVPASFRSKLLGASTRLTGVVCALVIGVGLFFGDDALEFVPVALIGGTLFFAGIGMIEEGLVRAHRRLPGSEYGIVVLIFVVIIGVGLIEGVAMGMLATLVFFALRLSRVDPVAAQFTARELRSNRDRPPPERAILLERADRIHGYRLRGYLFFGSAWPLVDHLKQSLEGASRPACLILDLRAVSGFDFSAVSVLGRFLQAAAASGVRVVLSAPTESLLAGLQRNTTAATFAELVVEPNEDRALERCEDLVVAGWQAEADPAGERRSSLLMRTVDDLERHLARLSLFEELAEELAPWLDARTYEAGEALTAPEEGVELLAAGRATACDADGARLRQCGPGDAIWHGTGPGENAVSVVADEPCRTMVLRQETWPWLEEHETQLALKLYRYLFASQMEAVGGSGGSTVSRGDSATDP